MEPNCIEEAIRDAKNHIATHTEQINPFDLHRILSFYENTLKESISTLEDRVTNYKRIPMPTLEQLKDGLDTLDSLRHEIQSLLQAVHTLESINGLALLNLHQALSFLDSYIRVDTTILEKQLTRLQKDTQQTIKRYQLQKTYLLYKESNRPDIQYPSSDLLIWSPEKTAGHYLSITQGNPAAAKEILLSILEQGYIMNGDSFLQTDKAAELISAIAFLSPNLDPTLDHQLIKSTLSYKNEHDLIDRGRGGEVPRDSTNPEKTTPIKETDTSGNTYVDPDPHPTENLQTDKPSNTLTPSKPEDPLETVQKKTPSSEGNTSSGENKPAPREITFEEYNQKGYLHSSLKKEHHRLTKRLLEIQKEFKNDISSATKDQMTKFTQTKTAIEDVQKRLDEAESEMNQLNQDIKNGRLIRVAMKSPSINNP